MKLPACCLAAFFLTCRVSAGAVIYTDSAHPVIPSPEPDVTVIFLDAAEQLQKQLFGPLSADPQQALQQAQTVIQTPAFEQAQAGLREASAGLLRAWSLGLDKYPAVVFDDKWVVYGTTDARLAAERLRVFKGGAQ